MPNEEMDAVRIELARQVSALKASNAELVAALEFILEDENTQLDYECRLIILVTVENAKP